jgi:hypothetical protein
MMTGNKIGINIIVRGRGSIGNPNTNKMPLIMKRMKIGLFVIESNPIVILGPICSEIATQEMTEAPAIVNVREAVMMAHLFSISRVFPNVSFLYITNPKKSA